MVLSRAGRLLVAVACVTAATLHPAAEPAQAARPDRPKQVKEPKAWINGKGMCVFPFASDELPDNADDFAAAMERGYRRALRLPRRDEPAVVIDGGSEYPTVDALRIDVCDAVFDAQKKRRKPSDRHRVTRALDAARFEVHGRGMEIEDATVNVDLTAEGARLMLARDERGKPLLVLAGATQGRMSVEVTLDDVERLLLAAARKGAGAYGVRVDKTRLKMTVEDERTVRVHLKLSTRVAGVVPAGLHFRARLDIDDKLNGRMSGLSATGDEALGPLISGIIQPFLERYNGTTRPLMNFPRTDMRLRDMHIDAGQTIRITADFGNKTS